MLIHLLIGGLAMGAVWFLFQFANNKQLAVTWWQWVITILGVLYSVFVLEIILGFLGEGVPQAAVVMGLVTALPAIIWFVLLFRFVFTTKEAAK